MEDSDTLKILATIEAVINGVIPYDKSLTNEEKLDVIYGKYYRHSRPTILWFRINLNDFYK